MAETKSSEQRGATTNNAILVAAIKIRRILYELDDRTRDRVIDVLNAIDYEDEKTIDYPSGDGDDQAIERAIRSGQTGLAPWPNEKVKA